VKILIADDDPVSQLDLQDALEDWGYDVVVASDGKTACEILERPDGPTLAVIDWLMPGMDGTDVCRRIRQSIKDRYVYLIMLTSRSETGFIVEAMTAGADDFISKPFDIEELKVRIRAGRRVNELERELRIQAAHAREALAAVKANEIRVQTIIDASQDAFVGIDLRGDITDWNAQAEKMFGWKKAEVIGRSFCATVVPQRFHECYEKALRVFNKTGESEFLGQHIERLVANRDSDEFPVEVTVGLAGTSETYFFSIFMHDISERKQVERMKNEFISTVSHELRTPLTSIRGSLGLLVGGAAGELPPQVKNLLGIANQNSERLVRLINNVLDIEKMESGNIRFDMVRQPVQPLVAQAIQAMHGYAAQFNVEVDLQSNGPDVDIMADSDRLVQVMVNLLSNAIKFSPAGASVEVRIDPAPGKVRLSVMDRGDGIPEKFRKRIFQRFAQADSTDSRQKGGTGLGLSICKSIVKEHGGHIDFRSETGAGTEFYIELPVAAHR
jgi:PAS domain S-box-containing protein